MARPLQLDLLQLRNAQLSIMVWLEFRKEKQVFWFVYLFVFHKWQNRLCRNPEEEQWEEWRCPQRLWTRAVMTQVWNPGLGLQVGHWSCVFPFCLGSVLPFRKLRQWHLVTTWSSLGWDEGDLVFVLATSIIGWVMLGQLLCYTPAWIANNTDLLYKGFPVQNNLDIIMMIGNHNTLGWD